SPGAGQGEAGGVGEEELGAGDDGQPDPVGGQVGVGQVGQAGVFAVFDAVFDPGVSAVVEFEHVGGQVRPVGQDGGVAHPVDLADRQLPVFGDAGRVLATHDQPTVGRPAADPAVVGGLGDLGDLGDPGGVDGGGAGQGRRPGVPGQRGGQVDDVRAGQGVPHGELHALLVDEVQQCVGGPGPVD